MSSVTKPAPKKLSTKNSSSGSKTDKKPAASPDHATEHHVATKAVPAKKSISPHAENVKAPSKIAYPAKKPSTAKSVKTSPRSSASQSSVKKSGTHVKDKPSVGSRVSEEKKSMAKKPPTKASTGTGKAPAKRKPKSTLSNIGDKLKSLFTFKS